MASLKETLYKKIQEERPKIQDLLKNHGDVVIDSVRVAQAIGGMRGIKSLVTDISYLDPNEGIRFRGYTIPEVFELLPKTGYSEMPLVEGFYYLLLTGDIPTQEQVAQTAEEFKKRKKVPSYVFDMLNALPIDSHPMTMFASAILSLQRESVFAKQYMEGLKKFDYWDPTYEDSLNLLAKLPEIASYIYRLKYKNKEYIAPDPDLDMGGNFAHMMGVPKPYDDVSRLYFILHSDHESGNVSAHTGHLIASALSDVYYAISGMLNGLAGPLHGLANQEVLRWIQDQMKKYGGVVPSKEKLSEDVWETLNSGQVIPGFGHAVLRKTDPRYTAQRDFCTKHIKNDTLFEYVKLLYEVVPPILEKQGKAKNPWPNVDAQSGVLQWNFGVKEYDFYTVLFGIGRALGVTANIIWDRALGYPLERPKSVTTQMLRDMVAAK
ncbi:MAG: citrate (Si)-synthase [Bacteroidetes bacterium]|nr:citrate (Si)-synthase [Bacteroidota bacterium]MBL6963132.1 citrate (Si)-synthase [Bacteroidota bacterium]